MLSQGLLSFSSLIIKILIINMKLTIAIPTYNRAKRLERALIELCSEIENSSYGNVIEVFVSNNGSDDETKYIIANIGTFYIERGIPFRSFDFNNNKGFDANIISCYRRALGEYVWFLSDDDNIFAGAINKIFADLIFYEPYVAYYNHDQAPYTKANPYIVSQKFFELLTDEDADLLSKIIKWPKLSSLVIKKCPSGLKVKNFKSGFAHVAIALQCCFNEGRVLYSPTFTAYPDLDYMDNIDYVPYVGNGMDVVLNWVLSENNKMYLYHTLKLPYCDPLSTSLNTLGAYYRGRYSLKPYIKRELLKTIHEEIKGQNLKVLYSQEKIKEIAKFFASCVYYVMVRKIVLFLVKNK